MNIQLHFFKISYLIKEALIKNEVDVGLLIELLCATSAVKNKQIPIFDKEVLEKIRSIDEFWERLRGLLKICNVELLKCIVEISGCKEAQDVLEEFLPKFIPAAVEDLERYWEEERWVELPMPVLSVTMCCNKFSLKVIKSVEEMMSKIYKTNEYALHFFRAEQDPVILHYHVSQSLSTYIDTAKIPENAAAELFRRGVKGYALRDRILRREIKCVYEVGCGDYKM